jgi:hypothetical protein
MPCATQGATHEAMLLNGMRKKNAKGLGLNGLLQVALVRSKNSNQLICNDFEGPKGHRRSGANRPPPTPSWLGIQNCVGCGGLLHRRSLDRPTIDQPAAAHFPAGWNYCQRQAVWTV